MSANGKKWSQYAEATDIVDADKVLVRDVSEAAGSQIKEMTKANLSATLGLSVHLADQDLHMPRAEITERANARQPSNGVYFNGSNSYLTGAGSFSALIGTSDFAVSWIMAYPTAANDDETIFEDGNVSLRIAGGASDYFRLRIDGTDYIIPTAIVSHDEDKHYVVDVDRSGNATLRIDGEDSGTIDVSAEAATVLTGSAYSINKTGTNGINAVFKSFIAWSRLLGLSYSQRLAANGNTPDVADQFGGDASYTADFTGDSVNGWSASFGNNSASVTVDAESDNVQYTSSAGASGSHYIRRTGMLKGGKRYRIRNLQYNVPSGNSNIDGLKILTGGTVLASLSITLGSWQTHPDVEFIAPEGADDLRILATDGGNSTFDDSGGDDTFAIRAMSLVPIGATVVLLPENILPTGNINDPANSLHAIGTNVTPLNRPTYGQFTEQIELAHGSISSSAATTKLLDLPKGCRVVSVETIVTTAFDAATTCNIGISGTPAKYGSGVNLALAQRLYNSNANASESDTDKTAVYVQKNQATTSGNAKFRVTYEVLAPSV